MYFYNSPLFLSVLLLLSHFGDAQEYNGIFQGSLSTNDHKVKGDVYIAGERYFYVKNFHYDGEAPDAFFWVDKARTPTENGEKAKLSGDPDKELEKLGKFTGQDVFVILPDNYVMSDVISLSVWCKEFAVNFGDIGINGDKVPKPITLRGFPPNSAHKVSSTNTVIMDTKTIKVTNFVYDGTAPDAFFLVGKGTVSSQGTKVLAPGQSVDKTLPEYSGSDVILTLPSDLTVRDIAYLSVFCFRVSQNFGHVNMPTPDSLLVPVAIKAPVTVEDSACKTLKTDKMNVCWKKIGNDVLLKMEGIVDELQYLAFGISGSTTSSQMTEGDVIIAYPRDGKVVVDDYYISNKVQCTGIEGVCMDRNYGGESSFELLSTEYADKILTVSYKRSVRAIEDYDQAISVDGDTSVIAAIGDVSNQGVIRYHGLFYNKETIMINFNDKESSYTPLKSSVSGPVQGWAPPKLEGVTKFEVAMGPTGGKKGFQSITGIVSWGIAYFINGILIPEITVEKGVQYEFVVESGNDEDNSAKYHPLYITTDPNGGAGAPGRTPDMSKILAGVTKTSSGQYNVTAGRLCMWEVKPGMEGTEKTANSFNEYKKSLVKKCVDGKAASFFWTPDENTPKTVYYQCWIHNNLGWKIHVSSSPHAAVSFVALLSAVMLTLFV